MNKGPLVAVLLLLTTSSPPAPLQDAGGGPVPPVFSSYSVLAVTIEAPFAELIENGRQREEYAVTGVLKLSDGGSTAFENVRITTRGHTSLRETECTFPKLKLDLTGSAVDGTILDGVGVLKIGTHCSDK